MGQVANKPARSRMVLLGCLDQHRVDVDSDHMMTGRREMAAQPAGAATGIEYAGAAGCHRVHETSLTGQILSGACHGTEAFDIPVRMSRIGFDLLHPDI